MYMKTFHAFLDKNKLKLSHNENFQEPLINILILLNYVKKHVKFNMPINKYSLKFGTYMFARDAKFLESESTRHKQLMKVTDLSFNFGNVSLGSFANPA